MSKIRQMAHLIRLAAADDYYARDLHEAIRGDGEVTKALQSEPVDVEDFGQLTPSEWQWFANWRQARGGPLDERLLYYLTDSTTTRFARFQVRALVLRDPNTNRNAIVWPARSADSPTDTGLRWLYRQARLWRIDRIGSYHVWRSAWSGEPYDPASSGDEESRLAREAEAGAERERGARREDDPATQLERLRPEEIQELTTDALQCKTLASWYLLDQIALTPFFGVVQERLERYADEHGLERGWFADGAPA